MTKKKFEGLKLFILVEGASYKYPRYEEAKVRISKNDPSEEDINYPFLCSPIFSYLKTPRINNSIFGGNFKLTYLIVNPALPYFTNLASQLKDINNLWFSLGLANVVILEKLNSFDGDLTISFFKGNNILTGYEQWEVNSGKLEKHENKHVSKISKYKKATYSLPPDLNPEYNFVLSEYIISKELLLNASNYFTNCYFNDHCNLFSASDKHFDYIIKNYNARGISESVELKDKLGRLIQFNSALSYFYNQTYVGTFPVLDHPGIIRRYSLLGIGTAVGALYELIKKLEVTFHKLSIENISQTEYNNINVPKDFFNSFFPYNHQIRPWLNDNSSQLIKRRFLEPEKRPGKDFFTRISFFSGRLGFREYDLSATSAIQVLVQSASLEWHVINYTHEIIHNHVRIILEPLIQSYEDNSSLVTYLSKVLVNINFIKKGQWDRITNFSYVDFFQGLLFNFCINSVYFGSLSESLDYDNYQNFLSGEKYIGPTENELVLVIKKYYKDISEIFVHILDFNYIYQQNLELYVISIWSSWSTQPVVISDIEQYILRTLLVISSSIPKGDSKERFRTSSIKFQSIIDEFLSRNGSHQIIEKIKIILSNKKQMELLEPRFSNCVVISDMVSIFFTANLKPEFFLNESMTLPDSTDMIRKNKGFYDLETGEFPLENVKSKTFFILDQLYRTLNRTDKKLNYDERISAWQLFILSSNGEI